jgi:ATP-dependent helicase HrpB
LPALARWLSPEQQELLRKHAPERVELATGKTPRVRYAAGALPYLALRIQELYDVRAIPRIAMGRVTPLVHVLAPNQRPVQVTHDLESFWREHYPALKKQLSRRYPKHEWR